jgi:hypothetical protein
VCAGSSEGLRAELAKRHADDMRVLDRSTHTLTVAYGLSVRIVAEVHEHLAMGRAG